MANHGDPSGPQPATEKIIKSRQAGQDTGLGRVVLHRAPVAAPTGQGAAAGIGFAGMVTDHGVFRSDASGPWSRTRHRSPSDHAGKKLTLMRGHLGFNAAGGPRDRSEAHTGRRSSGHPTTA